MTDTSKYISVWDGRESLDKFNTSLVVRPPRIIKEPDVSQVKASGATCESCSGPLPGRRYQKNTRKMWCRPCFRKRATKRLRLMRLTNLSVRLKHGQQEHDRYWKNRVNPSTEFQCSKCLETCARSSVLGRVAKYCPPCKRTLRNKRKRENLSVITGKPQRGPYRARR